MKKPVCKSCLVLWALAIVFPIVDTWLQWRAITNSPYAPYIPLHTNVFELLHNLFESIALVSGGLMAAGFAINILDQIRWNTLPPNERDSR